MANTANLKNVYAEKIAPALMKQFNYSSPMQIPVLKKIVVNQGLGGARNAGTAVAQGEWVTYLDSDDYVVDGGYRYLLDHFCGEDEGGVKLDVLCYSFRPIYTDGSTLADPDAKPDGKVTFEGDGVEAFNRWTQTYVWSKFYRRSFLQEHHIESEIVIAQDCLFKDSRQRIGACTTQ